VRRQAVGGPGGKRRSNVKAASLPRQKPLVPARLNRGPLPPVEGAVRLPGLPRVYGHGGDLDSRMRKPKLSPDGSLERMFCISCGAPSGWVTTEVVSVATYVCPSCTEKGGGPIPGLPRLNVAD
jgi:hypothetical protein